MQTPKPRSRSKPTSFPWIGLLFVTALGPFLAGWVHESVRAEGENAQAPDRQTQTAPANGSDAKDQYVGSQVCAQCHVGIYKQFSATHMGRSLAPFSPALLDTLAPSASLPASSYDPKMDRHFESFTRDGKLYQSEFQTGQDGKEIFRDTQQIRWIIGSGMNGFGGIVARDQYLFQGPLSFYSQAGNWALSPGYEFVDFGFSRPILAACISCHSGRPRPIAATNGRYAEPAFAETAIGCENCHGPGASHVQAMKNGSAPGQNGYPFIVNPGRLTAQLANNICMSCHQTGDLRILKTGKEYSDFRPGKPLDETLSILMVPPKREAPPQEDHLEHYYSMTLSKCYRASNGRLGCISCHNPHVEPSRAEAPAYFKQKCLACHTEKSCTLPIADRQRSNPPDDCSGCHMPKRDIREIRHSSVTNHRILARPGEPFPPEAFQQTTAALPDLIYLNPAPGQETLAPPPLTLLQAYGELSENHPEYSTRYFSLLDQLEHTDPGSVLVQTALGRRDLMNGKLQDAVTHFQLAIKIGPPQATTYGDLSEALAKLGQTEEALSLLQKAVDLDPFNPVLQKTMVLRYIQQKQYPNAKTALEHYLDVFPQDSFMRHLLDMASHGSAPQ